MSARGHRAGLVTPTILASRSVRSRRAAEAMAVPDPRERSQSSGVHSRTQSFESGATIATRRRAAAKLCLPHCFSPRRWRSCLFLLPQGGITVREPFQQATFGHDAGMPGSGIQRASRHPSIQASPWGLCSAGRFPCLACREATTCVGHSSQIRYARAQATSAARCTSWHDSASHQSQRTTTSRGRACRWCRTSAGVRATTRRPWQRRQPP